MAFEFKTCKLSDGTEVKGLYEILPKIFGDSRGYFLETYSERDFFAAGLTMKFVQDNQSKSSKGIYPEVFWHIISKQVQKGSKSNNTRLIDYKRAKRICWIKPIIQQYKDEQLTTWKSKEFDKNLGKEIYKYYLNN